MVAEAGSDLVENPEELVNEVLVCTDADAAYKAAKLLARESLARPVLNALEAELLGDRNVLGNLVLKQVLNSLPLQFKASLFINAFLRSCLEVFHYS